MYRAQNFKEDSFQSVKFTSKDGAGGYNSGTTSEELLNILIHRHQTLQQENPNGDNIAILEMLKGAKSIQSKRISRKIRKQKRNERNSNNKDTLREG